MDRESLDTLLGVRATMQPTSGLFHFWDHTSLEETKAPAALDGHVKLVVERTPARPTQTVDNGLSVAAICQEFTDDTIIDDDLTRHIEANTRKQPKSYLWQDLRIGRLTSSIFHDITSQRESTLPDSILKRMTGYSSLRISEEMEWGTDHEQTAISDYAKLKVLSGIHLA